MYSTMLFEQNHFQTVQIWEDRPFKNFSNKLFVLMLVVSILIFICITNKYIYSQN
jgi:hypothetical protein